MKLILALSGGLLVAGCSSLPMQVAANDSPMICDRALMARIDAQPQLQRAENHWVNCGLTARRSGATASSRFPDPTRVAPCTIGAERREGFG
jgi:hypothetical protein